MTMKKLLTTMLHGAALFAVSCTNAAGGGSGNGGTSGEIDYLARLIGMWETPGYDITTNTFPSLIQRKHLPLRINIKKSLHLLERSLFPK